MDFGLGLVLSFTDNATAGINNTANSLSRLTQIAEDASSSMEQMASLSALSVVASQVGNSFTTMGQTILSTFSQVIGSVNDVGTTIMYAEKQLSMLYGGAEEGQRVLANIQDYAKKSIFNFEDLIPVVTNLKSVGIEAFDSIASSTGNANQTLMDYASDLAAFNPNMRNAYGTGIQAAMGAIKEYIAEGNAMSLKRGAGLDITGILGEDKGATIEERSRQIADLVEQLGMVGMTSSLAGTPTQMLSNMEDVLFQFKNMISNSGVFDAYSGLISKFANYVFAIPEEELQNLASIIGSALTSILQPVGKAIDKLLSFADVLRSVVANNPKLVKFATIGASIAGVLLVVAGVALKATSAFSGLSLMFLASGKTFKSVGGLFKSGIAKIVSTLLPMIALLGVFYLAWKSDFAGIRTMTTSFVKNLATSFSTAKTAVNDSVEGMLSTLYDLQRKGDFFSNLTISIMKVMQLFKAVAESWNTNTLSEENYQKAKELGILPLVESILDLKYRFEFFKQGFIDGWKEIGDKVKTFITGFADNLDGTVFQTMLDSVATLLEKLASGDTQAWYDFGKSFADFTANAVAFMIALKGLEGILGFFSKIATIVIGVSKIGGAISKVFGGLWKVISKLLPNISGIIGGIVDVFKYVLSGAGTFTEALRVVFTPLAGIVSLVSGIAMAVVGFVKQLTDGFSWFWEIIKWIGLALGAVGAVILGITTGPIAALIAGIVGAVTTIIVLVKDNWAKITSFFSKVGAWIYNNVILPVAKFFTDLWNGIVNGVVKAFKAVKNFLSTIASWIYNNVISPVVNFFMTYIFPIIAKVVEIVAKVVEIVIALFGALVRAIDTYVVQPIVAFFKWAFDGIVSIFQNIASWFSEKFQQAVDGIKTAFGVVSEWISGVWNDIKSVFGNVASWFGDRFREAVDNIKTFFSPLAEWFSETWAKITDVFTKIGTVISDAISGAVKGAINSVLGGAVSIINGFVKAINFAIGAINKIPGVEISKLELLEVPELAQGGIVEKPTYAMIGEAGQEAVVPLENNTEWTGKVASLLSTALRDRAHDSGNYGAVASVINSCAGVIAQMMSVVSKIGENEIEATKTPVATQHTVSNSRTNNSSYMTSNNHNSTYQGDTDNSITFAEGSIVIHANGASDAEAMRMAKKIMELIKRQKELDDMLAYN